ncbi:CLUMA_CG002711, isoform A [Clunio marinus]|uniref:CLUMA_CG002711, isoform A n=1 Tax=Clunio marinus TaxID=568069 RepID=A0A1J1HLG9_9DIPT|nr:CLUMA_CG002711, isoform A [Clunio marinus]
MQRIRHELYICLDGTIISFGSSVCSSKRPHTEISLMVVSELHNNGERSQNQDINNNSNNFMRQHVTGAPSNTQDNLNNSNNTFFPQAYGKNIAQTSQQRPLTTDFPQKNYQLQQVADQSLNQQGN